MSLTIEAGRGGTYVLEHAVFDVNGTLTQDGQLVPGVIERMHILRRILRVHLLTADTYRTQEPIINPTLAVEVEPKIVWKILENKDDPEDEQKANYIRDLGKDKVVAIGNGMNDRRMLEEAKLGIVVLDLLLHPLRLKASLRT